MSFMEHSTFSESGMYLLGFGLVLLAVVCFAAYLLRTWHNRNYRRIPAKRVDPAHRTGLFYTPPSIRDGKGLR